MMDQWCWAKPFVSQTRWLGILSAPFFFPCSWGQRGHYLLKRLVYLTCLCSRLFPISALKLSCVYFCLKLEWREDLENSRSSLAKRSADKLRLCPVSVAENQVEFWDLTSKGNFFTTSWGQTLYNLDFQIIRCPVLLGFRKCWVYFEDPRLHVFL